MNINVRLDSSRLDQTGEAWRCACGPARRLLRCDRAGRATLTDSAGSPIREWDSPLPALAFLDGERRPGHRWIGYISYDLGPFLEPAAGSPVHAGMPLFIFSEHSLGGERQALSAARPAVSRYLGSNFSRDEYMAAVARAREYIAAGDIFQVNLAQQLRLQTHCTPAEIYTHIQQRFPAWYAALLDYGEFALVSNSPELFIRTWWEDGRRRIETRPIKGTRPRADGMRQALAESIKDQAELNMIIDLERNDLGRICRLGSVRVEGGRQIEEHPTVYHGSATVSGTLNDDTGLPEILQAMFPGGSITGAPKIRAMQIISELENEARGPYCGAIGYLDPDGSMQFNIAIRTLVIRGADVRVPVGGGIVADSQPAAEYEETLVKARAALVGLGVTGLPGMRL